MRLHITLCSLVLALSLANLPRAQAQVNFPTVTFRPAVNPEGFYVTEQGPTLPHLTPSAALMLNYAHTPLRLVRVGDGDFDHNLISYQLGADLMLGIGLFDRLELGLALPVTLAQGTDGLEALGRAPGASISGGLGDMRLIPKVRLLTAGPVTLALAAALSIPTGSDENLLGADSVTFTPQAVASAKLPYVTVGLNVGYRVRPNQTFSPPGGEQQVTLDDEVPISLGARARVWRELDVVGDVFTALSTTELDQEEAPLELLAGARYHFPYNLVANLGFGVGLTQGIGTPAFRVLAGVAYILARKPEPPPPPPPAPKVDPDPDHDGLSGSDDACPNDPEDKDNFEDEDGCPDNDNDKDGIADTQDQCPNKAEDKDGFEDEDGCPDDDNDKDGIPDSADKCPNKAEDKDGFEDQDGCPDDDNDKDGIVDAKDRCPMKPEVFNGVEDEDGCPDTSRGPVQIVRNKITVPPVYFATGKDRVLRRSLKTLRLVAETLNRNSWVKKVRVEGHTDSRGRDSFNLDLSQRRANSVVKHLITFGVDAARLEAKGFGETQPVASNKTANGRSQNRRVAFVIVDPAGANMP